MQHVYSYTVFIYTSFDIFFFTLLQDYFFCRVVQYDCQVEEAFISRALQEREANSIHQQQRDVSENAAASVSTTSSPTETAEVIEPSASQSVNPAQNPIPVCDVSSRGGQAQSAYGLINASSILTPTPIVATSAAGSLANGGASGSALRDIDLKDFEREQDPFENLSLRVINDREELNKVFHVTSPPSQHSSSAATAKTSTSAVANPNRAATTASSSSLLQYSASNVANGLNAANLNWVTCQPVPQWPAANHNMPTTCGSVVRPQHAPYVGRVSGPFADHANFPIPGTSYFGSSEFHRPQQLPATSMLRSAKSTPDISSLVNDHAVASDRRTPPPVFSDWSTASYSQSREKVRHVSFYFCLPRISF